MSAESSDGGQTTGDDTELTPQEIHGQLDFLQGGFKCLCETQVKADSKISAIDAKFGFVMSALDSIEHHLQTASSRMQESELSQAAREKAEGKRPAIPPEPQDSHHRPPDQERNALLDLGQQQSAAVIDSTPELHHDQVNRSNLERSLDENSLGYRCKMLNLENRQSLLQKIEMTVFAGELRFVWISLVERFFRIGQFDDAEKLDLIHLCLKGDVLKWFTWETYRREFVSWNEFKQRLFRRFGESIENEPGKRLFALQQLDSASDYVIEFQDVSA